MTYQVQLGHVVITPGAMDAIVPADVHAALGRHASGDWGEVCPEDWMANDTALRTGLRLLSVFRDSLQTRFWIITEADRSVTTILLPDEY
jgi:hypothetical protein